MAPQVRPPRGQQVELPPGHGAQIFPLATARGFIGGSYSMDSLTFMLWAARRYQDPEHRFVLVVLVALIGLQEVGGHIERTQDQIGGEIGGYSRAHVAWALSVLQDDGVLRRVRRGVYQLVPSGALRGGMKPMPEGQRRLGGNARGDRVEQLDLLREILQDPDAPPAFKAMAEADAQLPEGSRPKRKGK